MKYFFVSCFLWCFMISFAQEKDSHIAAGNTQFEKKNFAKAEAQYRIAHSKNTASSRAYYNLGNSIYRQGTASEAKYAYAKAIDVAKTREEKHRAYHNLGNVYMHEKNYDAAVKAYKNALRNNPYDEETRYNYALARRKNENNPPPPLKDKDRDKNQDRKKSDSDKKSKSPEGKGNEKDTAGNSGDNKQQQDKQGEGKEGRTGQGNRDEMPATEAPSEQRIKNILDAVNNEEKKIMDRVNSKKAKGSPAQQEKDW